MEIGPPLPYAWLRWDSLAGSSLPKAVLLGSTAASVMQHASGARREHVHRRVIDDYLVSVVPLGDQSESDYRATCGNVRPRFPVRHGFPGSSSRAGSIL